MHLSSHCGAHSALKRSFTAVQTHARMLAGAWKVTTHGGHGYLPEFPPVGMPGSPPPPLPRPDGHSAKVVGALASSYMWSEIMQARSPLSSPAQERARPVVSYSGEDVCHAAPPACRASSSGLCRHFSCAAWLMACVPGGGPAHGAPASGVFWWRSRGISGCGRPIAPDSLVRPCPVLRLHCEDFHGMTCAAVRA